MENKSAIPRLMRLNNILAPKGPIPVSKSTWWNKVRSGEYPSSIRLGPKSVAWKEADILALIKRFEEGK